MNYNEYNTNICIRRKVFKQVVQSRHIDGLGKTHIAMIHSTSWVSVTNNSNGTEQMSFANDIWKDRLPVIYLHGTLGTLKNAKNPKFILIIPVNATNYHVSRCI